MVLNNQEQEAAISILTRMLDLLGLSAEVALEEREERSMVVLKSEEPGRLIGRRGRVIENLEYLLNRSLSQRFEGAVNVGIDVEGGEDRSPRQASGEPARIPRSGGRQSDSPETERLRKMALDVAKEVRRWGGSKELGPLSADERRVVHSTLAEVPEVRAESGEPDEKGRKKVIVSAADEQ